MVVLVVLLVVVVSMVVLVVVVLVAVVNVVLEFIIGTITTVNDSTKRGFFIDKNIRGCFMLHMVRILLLSV